MKIDLYEQAAEKQSEADVLAGQALGAYWEKIAKLGEASDMERAMRDGVLTLEEDGSLLLSFGGPTVWLMPDGTMCAQWDGPRLYSRAPTARHNQAAQKVLEYLRQLREVV